MLLAPNISAELRAAMESWLQGRSQSRLARATGTSQTTIRRILQSEVNPEEGTALRIAHVVMPPESFQKFAGSVSPVLRKNASANYPVALEGLSAALQKPEYARIVILSCGLDGTDADEVSRKFGQSAVSYFNDLCTQGLLEKKGHRWFLAQQNAADISLETSRSLIGTLSTIADRENDSIPSAAIAYTIVESVKPEVILEANKEAMEFNERMFRKLCDPANRGDTLVTYGMISNIIKGRESLQ